MTFQILINGELCKGCALCVWVCPRSTIRMAKRLNSHGDHFAEVADIDVCVGCGQCADICPDAAIEIEVCEAPRGPDDHTRDEGDS